MDTIFMNSEDSKPPKPHVLMLKLTNKLELRIGKKVIALSDLSVYYTWKKIKKLIQIKINLKYLHQQEMMNLDYQMDLIPYHIFKIILNEFKKNMGKV